MLQEFRRLLLSFDSETQISTQFHLSSETIHQPFILRHLLLYSIGVLPFEFRVFGCVTPPATPLEAINFGYDLLSPESQIHHFNYGIEKVDIYPNKIFPQIPISLVIVIDNVHETELQVFAIAELDVMGSSLIPPDLFPPDLYKLPSTDKEGGQMP